LYCASAIDTGVSKLDQAKKAGEAGGRERPKDDSSEADGGHQAIRGKPVSSVGMLTNTWRPTGATTYREGEQKPKKARIRAQVVKQASVRSAGPGLRSYSTGAGGQELSDPATLSYNGSQTI
jgi:hypothetical protein